MTIDHRSELALFGKLPEFVLSFADTVPIACAESAETCHYIPNTHRIEIGNSALSRRDVSMLMHEIAHAWHYKYIKNMAGKQQIWNPWNSFGPVDQKLHELFHMRRNQEWCSSGGTTWDQLAEETEIRNPIEHATLIRFCLSMNVKHYAMCNPDEFFAVLSDMYWLKSDWPPFSHEGLKTFDPEAHALVAQLWQHA